MKNFKRVTKKSKKEWAKFYREATAAQKHQERIKQDSPKDYKALVQFQKSVGKKVKEYRNKAKMSIEELSERSDLPLDYLQAIEDGKINCFITDTYSIAYVLGIKQQKLYQ